MMHQLEHDGERLLLVDMRCATHNAAYAVVITLHWAQLGHLYHGMQL